MWQAICSTRAVFSLLVLHAEACKYVVENVDIPCCSCNFQSSEVISDTEVFGAG